VAAISVAGPESSRTRDTFEKAIDLLLLSVVLHDRARSVSRVTGAARGALAGRRMARRPAWQP